MRLCWLCSVEMIASLGGDVKPLSLSPSFSFFISQNRRGHKNPHYHSKRGRGFLGGVVYLSRITHHSYHGLWVDYCKLINGLIAVPVVPCVLKLTVNIGRVLFSSYSRHCITMVRSRPCRKLKGASTRKIEYRFLKQILSKNQKQLNKF